MELFINTFIFIYLSILYYIKCQEVNIKIWNRTEKIEGYNFEDINSYAFDSDTGAELFLINHKSELYLKDEAYTITIKNITDINEIHSPLIKLNSFYYFCCSSSQELMKIDGNTQTIQSIPNPKEITSKTNINDFSIKCLLSCIEINNIYQITIMSTFIGTEYIYFLDLETNKYFESITFQFEENKRIMAIHNVTNEQGNNQFPEFYYVLVIDNLNENNIIFKYMKWTKERFIGLNKEVIIEKKLYQKNEIVGKTVANVGTIIYLFSYEPYTNNFDYYIVNIEKEFFEGKYYLIFFNEFQINYVKFMAKTPMLYYSIKNMKNNKNYFGVADLEFFLIIFNLEENLEENLDKKLYNNYINNQGKIFYFSKNEKISFCPFIEDSNHNCYYTEEYFDIIEIKDGLFNNEKDNCNDDNKVKMKPYCINNCPNGYQNNEDKTCSFCHLYDNGKYYNYGTQKCSDGCSGYEEKQKTCYNCEEGNKKIYHNYNCIESCDEVYGYQLSNNTCRLCKENGTYYSHYYKYCIDKKECKGIINDYYFYCYECRLDDKLFFHYNSTCLNNCYSYFIKDDFECKLCDDNDTYYDNGNCVNKCNENNGYGVYKDIAIINKTYNETVNYCEKCKTIDPKNKGYFLKNGTCEKSCGSGYYIDNQDLHICKACGTEEFYVEKIEKCLKDCPKGTRETSDKICTYCQDFEYYYENGDEKKCLSECNQIILYKNENNISYNECIFCSDNEIFNENKCINCSGNNYLSSNNKCYRCFCGGEFNCSNSSSQCNCLNSLNYYGYSCEFYSEKNINEKDMKIISITNRLIKTNQNFFTYILQNNKTLSNIYSFSWKLYLNNKEITGTEEYKNCFITSANESFFGINKNLFEDNNNKNFTLSLDIKGDQNYTDTISLIIIDSFEYENSIYPGINASLNLIEMESDLKLANQKEDQYKKYNGKYYFQYGLLDENNERLPLTDYIDEEICDINSICSEGYYINIKNDREEIKTSKNILDSNICQPSNVKISEIIGDNNKYLNIEKIFLLISYFREKNEDQIISEETLLTELNKFINNNIMEIINENGIYIESNEEITENENIKYSEPKLIFSLIYYYSNFMKNKNRLNKNNINEFFGFFETIFNKAFENISNKTFNDSDIKSLFRTVDNLYDICIAKNINSRITFNYFIQILDNITKYLAYTTYPSETFVLKGKRISLLTHHLGKYENSISFPYIYYFDTDSNNTLSYYYSNYYLNEGKYCEQKISTLFCLNKDNLTYLTYLTNMTTLKLNSNTDEETNDIILNVYLLPEINNTNEKEENNNKDAGFNNKNERITVNKNYSVIFKLFHNESHKFTQIDDNNTFLRADFEFPFGIDLNKGAEERDNRC